VFRILVGCPRRNRGRARLAEHYALYLHERWHDLQFLWSHAINELYRLDFGRNCDGRQNARVVRHIPVEVEDQLPNQEIELIVKTLRAFTNAHFKRSETR